MLLSDYSTFDQQKRIRDWYLAGPHLRLSRFKVRQLTFDLCADMQDVRNPIHTAPCPWRSLQKDTTLAQVAAFADRIACIAN